MGLIILLSFLGGFKVKKKTYLFVCFAAIFLFNVASAQAFESSPIGWASVNDLGYNGTTGGAGGPTVTVTTEAQLVQYASSTTTGPYIIQVQGTIGLTARLDISSNKTLIGIGTDPTITGPYNLRIRGQDSGGVPLGHNIIVRNLILSNHSSSDKDGLTIQDQAHHVWVDHCDFSNNADGACDISHACDYVTISWNRFHDQDKTCLLGHSPSNGSEDTGHLKVTYHHNYFGATQRQPRVRFSFLTHVYNNYYVAPADPTNNYGIASTCDAFVLAEGNYFQNMQHPMYSLHYSGDPNGWLIERYNTYFNSGAPEFNPPTSMPEPSTYYSYTLDNSANIPTIVGNGAGVNKIYAPDTIPPEPNPMTFAIAPEANSTSSIVMTATTATDESGVEYYFHCTTTGGHDSSWQDSTHYVDRGLATGTTYTYQVKARDKSTYHNETAYSDPASAATFSYNCTSPIASDLNHDCKVDFADFALFAADWLACNRNPSSECGL
jgi:pectate lyase